MSGNKSIGGWGFSAGSCRVEVPVTRHLPLRSRRAAFLHRALAGSQAVSTFGAWAAHSASIRAAVPPVTCLFRRCVRGMLWYRPFLPAGSLPSTLSAAAPQLCSNASSVVWTRPTPRAFRGSFVSSTSCRGPSALVTSGDTRSPRFRRDPFVRDVALDHGRATVPRVAAPHMLPSTVATVSAPASSRFSRLNPTPHTITVYASPWSSPSTAQHSFPGRCYPLPGPDFHRLDPASFAWRTAHPSHPAAGAGLYPATTQDGSPGSGSQSGRSDPCRPARWARYPGECQLINDAIIRSI